MRKLLLLSNRVMHYRVSVYNYFFHEFRKCGWEFIVRSNELQRQNPHPIDFDFDTVELSFHKCRTEIQRIAPDVVILFLHLKDRAIWPLVHWLKLRRMPVAFWTKGMNLDDPGNTVSQFLYRYMHRMVDALILYSQHEVKFINQRYAAKVFVANNTVNFRDYPDIGQSKEDIKREFRIPFRKVVLSVGRMGEGGGRKKVDHLIKIFGEMNANGSGLVIVGEGVSKEALNAGAKDNVKYLGEVYDPKNIQISKIFKMADVFSIPGHVGLGLNQAFFWGLPVVTEEGPQPPEIHYLVNGRNGFIVPENDLAALKSKILYLLENDGVRRTFSENAREDILRHASIENMFDGFKRCAESLACR